MYIALYCIQYITTVVHYSTLYNVQCTLYNVLAYIDRVPESCPISYRICNTLIDPVEAFLVFGGVLESFAANWVPTVAPRKYIKLHS